MRKFTLFKLCLDFYRQFQFWVSKETIDKEGIVREDDLIRKLHLGGS